MAESKLEDSTNCEVCNNTISTRITSEHLRSHVGDYDVACPNFACNYASISPRHLEELHLRQNPACLAKVTLGPNGNIRKQCELCAFETDEYDTLRCHLRVVHYCDPSLPRPFNCPFESCIGKFSTRFGLQLHLEVHIYEIPEGSKKRCGLCKVKVDVDKLKDHLRSIHDVKTPFECKFCSNVSHARESFLDHFIAHRVNKECRAMPIYCDICQIEDFTGLNALRQHYLEQHQIGKEMQCEYCDFKTIRRGAFDKHMKKVHGETFPFTEKKRMKLEFARNVVLECEICLRMKKPTPYFNQEEGLNGHKMKVHFTSPHKCRFCRKMFVNDSQMKKHERKVHNYRRAQLYYGSDGLSQELRGDVDQNLSTAG